jgi:hypothetical protein
MNDKENKVFRWIHNYTATFVNNNINNANQHFEFKKLNNIYKELVIRNSVMNVTSPLFFMYIYKNKI